MNVQLIKTEEDYQKSLIRLEQIFDSQVGTEKGDELEILSLLIERYEDEHYPIESPDPIEAIKFRMEQMEFKPKDLSNIIGSKSHVSEILNRKRKLSLDMIRKLHEKLNIPLASLIRAY